MAKNENKKYYWLQLKKDFFKDHKMVVIESLPNGKDYILFYLKLITESTSYEGYLRFSETIPYNDSMLASITNTNIDIVRSAIKIFKELELLEVLDDQTFYFNQVEKMLGYTTKWAQEKAEYREEQKKLKQQKKLLYNNKTILDNVLQENRDKSLEIRDNKKNKDNNTHTKSFIPPTLEQVKQYCQERNNQVDASKFIDFYTSKGWMVGKNKMKDWKASVRTWEKDTTSKNAEINIGFNSGVTKI